MNYPTYDKYQSTKIPWLSDVPDHWAVDRLKWTVLGCQNGIWGDEPDGDDDIVCIRVADFNRTKFILNSENLTFRKIDEKDRNKRKLIPGDLLIEKSGGGEKQLVGAVIQFNEDFDAVSSNFIAKMTINDGFDSRYLAYLHAHLYSSKVNYRSIKQTTGIQNLDSQQYLNELVIYPPFEEQQTIAAFLDYKTEQIDKLIEKKEQLLKLLEEKRIALITQAVTKGLDPKVKMKPSGIDWLGDIPVHWDNCKAMYLSRIITGGTPSRDNIDYWEDGEIPWLNSGEVNKKIIVSVENKITKLGLLNSNARIIPAPAVLIALNGQGKTKGMVALLEVDSTCSQSLAAIVPSYGVSYKFLYYHLESKYYDIRGLVGEARDGLNLDHIKQLYFPLPPFSEQIIITAYLDIETKKIKLLSQSIEDAINKLKEYRTALITSAVTGKIDVRDFKPPREE